MQHEVCSMTAKNEPGSKASDPMSTTNEPTKAQSAVAVADATTSADDQSLSPAERQKRGERIIQDHVLMGLVAGLIPGPAIDLAAGFGVQLTMLGRLAKLHGVPFRRDLAKNIVTSLFGSLGGVGAGVIIASSVIKTVPVLGTALGFVGTSASMGGFTYAVGKLFQQHFEQGGTFDDLEPSSYRDYFRDMFKRGKAVAAEKAEEAAEQATAAKRSAKAAGAAAAGA
jgi:uncharacterized protein (DUF697 family)